MVEDGFASRLPWEVIGAVSVSSSASCIVINFINLIYKYIISKDVGLTCLDTLFLGIDRDDS